MAGERSDVPDVMCGLDGFVLPSLAEGISNTILEAMASGLPVLATAVGGNPELVVDGVTGLLVPSGDVPELTRALASLAADGALRRRLGDAAAEHCAARFTIRAVADRWEAVLRSVARPR